MKFTIISNDYILLYYYQGIRIKWRPYTTCYIGGQVIHRNAIVFCPFRRMLIASICKQCISQFLFVPGEFDMRVKSCVASDGGGHVIQLSDEFGCVLRPKMISRFLKARGADERASVITYAFFHAFKFPDALSVHIKCKVEICRHGCLDHCQLQPEHGDLNPNLLHYDGPLERKDDKIDSEEEDGSRRPESLEDDLHDLYDDIIHEDSEELQNG